MILFRKKPTAYEEIDTFLHLLFLLPHTICTDHYKTINSSRIGKKRELKIQLPRKLRDRITEKTYPLIIVLDGDYLLNPWPVMWITIPTGMRSPTIVVGVNQIDSRDDDSMYDFAAFPFFRQKRSLYFEFLGMEAFEVYGRKYRTSKFVGLRS